MKHGWLVLSFAVVMLFLVGVVTVSAQSQYQEGFKVGDWVEIIGAGNCAPDGTIVAYCKPPSSGIGQIQPERTYWAWDKSRNRWVLNKWYGAWVCGVVYHVQRPLQGGDGWYTRIRHVDPPWWSGQKATPTPTITSVSASPASSAPRLWPSCGGPYIEGAHMAYDICAGDVLSLIARKCGVSVDKFRLNGQPIPNPNWIQAGWHLTYVP